MQKALLNREISDRQMMVVAFKGLPRLLFTRFLSNAESTLPLVSKFMVIHLFNRVKRTPTGCNMSFFTYIDVLPFRRKKTLRSRLGNEILITPRTPTSMTHSTESIRRTTGGEMERHKCEPKWEMKRTEETQKHNGRRRKRKNELDREGE